MPCPCPNSFTLKSALYSNVWLLVLARHQQSILLEWQAPENRLLWNVLWLLGHSGYAEPHWAGDSTKSFVGDPGWDYVMLFGSWTHQDSSRYFDHPLSIAMTLWWKHWFEGDSLNCRPSAQRQNEIEWCRMGRSDPIEDDCVTNRVFGVPGALDLASSALVTLWQWVPFNLKHSLTFLDVFQLQELLEAWFCAK